MKKIRIIILIVTYGILLVGCSIKNNTSEDYVSKTVMNELEEELKIKDKKIDEYKLSVDELEKVNASLEQDLIALNSTIAELNNSNLSLEEDLSKLKSENQDLIEDIGGLRFEHWTYEAIYHDYRRYIDSTITETYIDDTQFKINNIAVGSSYKDVLYVFGEPSEETIGFNEGYGENSSYMTWKYNDDLVIMFNPIFAESIIISSSEYTTNLNIQVGDLAVDALEYCNSNFEKYYGTNYSQEEPLLGWYYTKNGNVLIMHFNKDGNRIQNNITISADTKVEKIEYTTDLFD